MTKKEEMAWKQQNVNRGEQVFQRRQPHRLHNRFKSLIATSETNRLTPKLVFNAFVYGAPLTRCKPTEFMLKKVAKLGDSYNTKGYAIPVNVDMNVKDHMVKPPIELVREAIRHSSYRVIQTKCACREIEDCKDYSQDIGCMFLGRGAKACVEHGSGREATVEECLAHVDRAIEAGLSVGTYWVEFEQYAWGFQDEDFPDFIAFCFCCPCCCHEIKFENLAGGELKHLLHQSVGWHCEPIAYKCIACGSCVSHCPRGYLKIEKGVIRVDSHCAGCGLCLNACKQGALHVVQYAPTKEHLQDYFEKLNAQW